MPPPTAAEPPDSRPARLDGHALDRAWQRLSRSPEPPWLHGEVARRMGERLPIVKQVPRRVLDWWGALGASGEVLRAAYPQAELIAVRRPGDASSATKGAWWQRLGIGPRTREQAEDEVEAGLAQLGWSNMALHWSTDVPALLAKWHRAIAVDGFLMFSTLGPGTLTPLRAHYAAQGWGPAFAPWIDMHDLGDMLVEAGFADPVMDQEVVRLSFSSPKAALAELRGLGANLDRGRFAGLRGRAWLEALEAAIAGRADAQGRCVLEFEVVYGHAFRPAPRARVAARTEVGLDEMKSMLSRRGPSK